MANQPIVCKFLVLIFFNPLKRFTMKPALRIAVPSAESSFTVRRDTGTKMKNNWHYHPEYELLYIKRSIGTWLVGDYIGPFKSGDVILIGQYLPHSFRHNHAYVEETYREPGKAIVALFLKEVFGDDFLGHPEMREIKNMLKLSERGLRLTGTTQQTVGGLMEEISYKSPSERLIDLLSALRLIAEKKEYDILASEGFAYERDVINSARMIALFEYTFNHYQDQIRIEEVAKLVNMAVPTFCHYFKKKTKKTYVEFLTTIRIGNACKLLMEGDINISGIAYACGYNSISHFNHQFKAIKHKSPRKYRQEYLNHLSVV